MYYIILNFEQWLGYQNDYNYMIAKVVYICCTVLFFILIFPHLGGMTIGKNKFLESSFFRKWGKFYRADFWNRANVFTIYLIKEVTATETICEPLSLKEGCYKSYFTEIRFVELEIWMIQHFFKLEKWPKNDQKSITWSIKKPEKKIWNHPYLEF